MSQYIPKQWMAKVAPDKHCLSGAKWRRRAQKLKNWGKSSHSVRCSENCQQKEVPSGELTFCHGKSPFLVGKSTISMAIFHCFLYVHQRVKIDQQMRRLYLMDLGGSSELGMELLMRTSSNSAGDFPASHLWSPRDLYPKDTLLMSLSMWIKIGLAKRKYTWAGHP